MKQLIVFKKDWDLFAQEYNEKDYMWITDIRITKFNPFINDIEYKNKNKVLLTIYEDRVITYCSLPELCKELCFLVYNPKNTLIMKDYLL